MNYFITGTDTNCGKTFVTALLVRAGRAVGLDTIGAKPICSGPRDDVEKLSAANGDCEPLGAINPLWFQTPVAPQASVLFGEEIPDYDAAIAAMRLLAYRHDNVLCEGVGGWMVPLRPGYTMADFAAQLGWPVVIVARNRLGVLNHVLLTADSIRNFGLELAGVILNDAEAASDEATKTNARILEETLGKPLLLHVPHKAKEVPLPVNFLRR